MNYVLHAEIEHKKFLRRLGFYRKKHDRNRRWNQRRDNSFDVIYSIYDCPLAKILEKVKSRTTIMYSVRIVFYFLLLSLRGIRIPSHYSQVKKLFNILKLRSSTRSYRAYRWSTTSMYRSSRACGYHSVGLFPRIYCLFPSLSRPLASRSLSASLSTCRLSGDFRTKVDLIWTFRFRFAQVSSTP